MPVPALVRNYLVERHLAPQLPRRIEFWDETLRDGEQMPGVHFTPEEKLRIARLLDEVGVQIIDVGMPVVSKEEAKAVQAIAREGLKATILAAARAVKGDVDATIQAEVDEVSIFIGCSELHLQHKLKMSRQQVLDLVPELIHYAKEHGLRVSFVTEDTVRADIEYVVPLYTAAVEAGADRAIICDTVGVMTPAAMRWFITEVKGRIPPVQLGVHCHNDFGMGVANTLAALEAGAEVPHTTVNGIGERAGNTALEETVVALEALYGHTTGIKVDRLPELSALVEELSGIPIALTKPIVGYNAFRHESGIHTDGVLKNSLTYEPIQPEMVGRKRSFILGKHTGAAAVRDRLKAKDLKLTNDQVNAIVQAVKEKGETLDLTDQRAFVRQWRQREEKLRGVSEEEFWAIVERIAGPRLTV